MSDINRPHELVTQAVIAAPSVTAILVTKVLGLHINDWLGLLGIGFLALQAAGYLWRWRRDIRIEKERQKAAQDLLLSHYEQDRTKNLS